MMLKNAITLIISLLSITTLRLTVYAQVIPSLQLYGSPDGLRGNGKAADANQPNNNGTPNISIPLLKTHPVSISYDAAGIKPDQLSGVVGLGWSLQVGGKVTRVIHGLRDERANMHPQGITTAQHTAWRTIGTSVSGFAGNIGPISQMFDDLNLNNTYNQGVPSHNELDTAPDEFRYNILGRTGTFLFKPDGTVLADRQIKVQVNMGELQRSSGLRMSHSIDDYDRGGTITGITIVFEDGVECQFKEPETENHHLVPSPDPRLALSDSIILLNNTWKITKITYPQQRIPTLFEYVHSVQGTKRYSSDDVAATQKNFRLLTAQAGFLTTNAALVKTITGPDYKILFAYNETVGRLDSIVSCTPMGKHLNRCTFFYRNVGTSRYLLDKVEADRSSSLPATTTGSYRFVYNSTAMPDFAYFPFQDFTALRLSDCRGEPGCSFDPITSVPAPRTNTAGD